MVELKQRKVLVTGANGFIAARTVKAFLDAGYSVRGTVRSTKSGEAILGVLKEEVQSGRFELAIVPDITKAGAFDKAVEGVHAIAHLAAPISLFFTDPVPVMHGAIQGTKTLLNSAFEHGKDVQTVVQMSSIASILSPREHGYIYSEKDWNEASEQEVESKGSKASSRDIYSASKTAAERAFWKFRDENKPKFTMAAVNPALVGGPPLLLPEDPKNISETVGDVYKILSGGSLPPSVGSGVFVDIRDVARLFVFVVDNPEQTNGERYLAASAAKTSQAIADILREAYPERRGIIQEGNPGQDSPADISLFLDTSKAAKALGVPFTGLKESVLAAAKAFEVYL